MGQPVVYEPLQGLVSGILQGHQVANMIRRTALEQEAAQRQAFQQEREGQLQDIQQRMLMNQYGRPIENGAVRDQTDLPGVMTPIDILRKPDAGRTVNYKTQGGDQISYELKTPEEQAAQHMQQTIAEKMAEGHVSQNLALDQQQALMDKFGYGIPDPNNPGQSVRVLPQQIGETSRGLADIYGLTHAKPKEPKEVGIQSTHIIADDKGRQTLVTIKTDGTSTETPLQSKGKTKTVAAAPAGSTPDDAKLIAQGIIEGRQPPLTTGLYRNAAPVRAELERSKYDLATAQRDYTAVQRHLATLNGAQQERLRQAISFTSDSLDNIDSLYKEWQSTGLATKFKSLNKITLAAAKQLPGHPGEVATALEAQINDLTSELGTVYKGGNASTDESLRLAAENLKGSWNEETFKRNVEQIRKNLQIRRNSVMTSAPAGVSENSPYFPPSEKPAPSPTAPIDLSKFELRK